MPLAETGRRMIIISNEADIRIGDSSKCAVAIGKFDGIHRGHEKLIRTLHKYREKGYKTAVFTFDIKPDCFLNNRESKVLTTVDEKRLIFSDLNIDYLIEFPFYEKTACISAESFLEDILMERLNCRAVVCGPDLSFGYKGRGNVDLIRSYAGSCGIIADVVEKVMYEGEPVSSSRIRDHIVKGEIEKANEMLLRPYMFYGTVVHGRKLGRTIGMPTVNLLPKPEKLMPKNGVYYSRVRHMGMEYRSITNIGSKPTIVKNGSKDEEVMGVETYIYNFNEEIYGDDLLVSLYHYVRGEKDFGSVESLKEHMGRDIRQGEEWHRQHI
ncbi:MAG: bifunctional riboflavin kinase/FAD synthetase [Lachnospiraceae bacterium]|nr:bifunctional riboflavin kinase/FAD synthetase [Lachnospiraceae bacterium]